MPITNLQDAESARPHFHEDICYSNYNVPTTAWCGLAVATAESVDAYAEAIRATERARVARLVEAVEDFTVDVECHCDEAYANRGLHEPNSFHRDWGEEVLEMRAALADLKEMPDD